MNYNKLALMEDDFNPKDLLKSNDIEMAVVGCIFTDDNSAYMALSQLSSNDFENVNFRNIFDVSKNYFEQNKSIDRNVIESRLIAKHPIEGKYSSIISKSSAFSDKRNIEIYCRELQAYTFRRNLYDKSEQLMHKASDMSVEEDELHKEMESVTDVSFSSTPEVARTSKEIKEQSKEQEPQLTTGLQEWDDWFYKEGGRGLGTTELIFSRPGHGKTFYMFRKIGQLALNGAKGLHFHLEDTDLEASLRLDAVVDPELPENENVLIIDNQRYLHDIVKSVRYYKHKYDIQFASFDHLGRIQVSGFRANEKLAMQIETSNTLTDLCKDLDIHGILSVQPNKSYSQRYGYKNLLREEDLKGATEIFEDAFVVTTLFRPNLYPELRVGLGEDAKVKSPSEKREVDYNSLFVNQIKNRRQKITGEFMHFIQRGSMLYTEREFRYLPDNKKVTSIEEDLPF